MWCCVTLAVVFYGVDTFHREQFGVPGQPWILVGAPSSPCLLHLGPRPRAGGSSSSGCRTSGGRWWPGGPAASNRKLSPFQGGITLKTLKHSKHKTLKHSKNTQNTIKKKHKHKQKHTNTQKHSKHKTLKTLKTQKQALVIPLRANHFKICKGFFLWCSFHLTKKFCLGLSSSGCSLSSTLCSV